jgi:lipopolysaccharide transport system permease protein
VATLLPALIDFSLGLLITLIVAFATGGGVSATLPLTLPLGVVLLVLAAAGPVLLFSATVVRYRDVNMVVSFGLQFVLFLSPVAYPPSLVPHAWRVLLYANPLAGALGLLRTALLDVPLPPLGSLALSFAVALLMLLIGLVHFRRHERFVADII